jgi:serine/threonine protein kinase
MVSSSLTETSILWNCRNLSGNPIEPWELSPEQFTFLSNLEKLSIDQTAFASCSVERQRQLHARLTVCVSSSSASTKPTNTKGSSSRSRSSDQLLYLGGSFLIAILIALWIFMVRRRRARAEEIASAASNPSAAASPSPIQRAASLMSPPARPLGSASLTYERTRRSSRPSTASGRIPPLSTHQLTREISDQSTFWEDEELQSWRLEFEGAQQQARIAVGVFTEVWRASYGADTVAVKRLKASLRRIHLHHPETLEAGVLDDFVFEIRVLSRLDHPRIVSFFGVAWTRGSELSAIMEYVPQQDLRGFLSQQQPSTWAVEMVHAALCVAEALVYLHTQEVPLIHGNVQAANVLLTDRLDAKLCDFGSAQYCTAVPLLSLSDRSRPTNASDARGSSSLSLASVRADATPWIAPEVLRSQAVCDPSIDMYAFGVLLSEIDTHAVPYSSGEAAVLNDLEIRHHVAVGQLRPAFTSTCPLSLLALATRCLAFEPQDRATSTDAAFALRGILSAVTSSESERLSASNSTQETSRSTMGPLFHLPSNDSDSDMSQRTLEFRRYSSA